MKQTKTNKPMTREEWEALPAIVQYFLRDEKPEGCEIKPLAPSNERGTSAPLSSLEAQRKGAG